MFWRHFRGISEAFQSQFRGVLEAFWSNFGDVPDFYGYLWTFINKEHIKEEKPKIKPKKSK